MITTLASLPGTSAAATDGTTIPSRADATMTAARATLRKRELRAAGGTGDVLAQPPIPHGARQSRDGPVAMTHRSGAGLGRGWTGGHGCGPDFVPESGSRCVTAPWRV